jgi:hypothetical protein
VFVPLALVALHNVAEQDSGVASSMLNAAQHVGGAIGLALLGTVAWTAVADSVRTQVAHAAAGRPLPKPGTPPPASIYDHALAVGFSRAFVVAAGIALLALLIGIVTIRVSRQELAGAVPEPQEAASQPEASQPEASQPGLCSGMRTEPPSPRRPVRAGSASRHVSTTWEKSAGTTPAPRPTTAQRPRRHHAVFRAHLPWLPARARRPPHADCIGQDNPAVRLARV